MLKVLKWIGILFAAFVVFVVVGNLLYKPKTPKQEMEKAAKDCFVEKAQNRMSDAPCRDMERTARSL